MRSEEIRSTPFLFRSASTLLYRGSLLMTAGEIFVCFFFSSVGLGFHEFYDVADGLELFRLFVGNFDAEFRLDAHDDLHRVLRSAHDCR